MSAPLSLPQSWPWACPSDPITAYGSEVEREKRERGIYSLLPYWGSIQPLGNPPENIISWAMTTFLFQGMRAMPLGITQSYIWGLPVPHKRWALDVISISIRKTLAPLTLAQGYAGYVWSNWSNAKKVCLKLSKIIVITIKVSYRKFLKGRVNVVYTADGGSFEGFICCKVN